jgi:hypothetical protein
MKELSSPPSEPVRWCIYDNRPGKRAYLTYIYARTWFEARARAHTEYPMINTLELELAPESFNAPPPATK